jgi:AcrR family transcriptional regulator
VGFTWLVMLTLRTMASPVKRPSGHHHGDLRSALEEAALALIAEVGPRGFSLAEATRRAGVSVAAPYKHYADRDALLAALALRCYAEQLRRFEAAIATAADPVEQLASFASAYVQFAFDERALFQVTFAAGLDKSAYPELTVAGEAVLDVLRALAAKLRQAPDEALDLALTVAAAAHGLSVFLLEDVFGDPPAALGATRERAATTARALAGVEQALSS